MSEIVKLASKIMVMAIIISVMLLFLGIGLLIVIHLCVVGRAFRRRFGTNFASAAERSSNGSTSMSKDELEKLPCFDYIAKSPADCCAVCLESFKTGEKCRLLPFCQHSFHAECVDLWLLKNPICPICRTPADSSKAGLLVNVDEENGHSSDFVRSEVRDDYTTGQNDDLLHVPIDHAA